jgi:hypothetical protein
MFFLELFGDVLHKQKIPLSRDPVFKADSDFGNTEIQGHQWIRIFIAIFTSCLHSF